MTNHNSGKPLNGVKLGETIAVTRGLAGVPAFYKVDSVTPSGRVVAKDSGGTEFTFQPNGYPYPAPKPNERGRSKRARRIGTDRT